MNTLFQHAIANMQCKKRDREEQSAEIFNILPSTILKNIYEQNNN